MNVLHKMQKFRTRYAARRSQGAMADTSQKISAAKRPADDASVRAKSRRHGKSTADKWNQ
jgi:hypothetical protein